MAVRGKGAAGCREIGKIEEVEAEVKRASRGADPLNGTPCGRLYERAREEPVEGLRRRSGGLGVPNAAAAAAEGAAVIRSVKKWQPLGAAAPRVYLYYTRVYLYYTAL